MTTIPDDPSASPVALAIVRYWAPHLSPADFASYIAPVLPLLPGSRGDAATEQARALLACDWAVRTSAPAWLTFGGLTAEASALAALTPLGDRSTFEAAIVPVNGALAAASGLGGALPASFKVVDRNGVPERVGRLPPHFPVGQFAEAALWAAAWACSTVRDPNMPHGPVAENAALASSCAIHSMMTNLGAGFAAAFAPVATAQKASASGMVLAALAL